MLSWRGLQVGTYEGSKVPFGFAVVDCVKGGTAAAAAVVGGSRVVSPGQSLSIQLSIRTWPKPDWIVPRGNLSQTSLHRVTELAGHCSHLSHLQKKGGKIQYLYPETNPLTFESFDCQFR